MTLYFSGTKNKEEETEEKNNKTIMNSFYK